MSNEQREAIVIAGDIARLNGGKAAERLTLAREIAAALLEARADGRLNGPPFGELTLEYVARLRAEAAALREGTL